MHTCLYADNAAVVKKSCKVTKQKLCVFVGEGDSFNYLHVTLSHACTREHFRNKSQEKSACIVKC